MVWSVRYNNSNLPVGNSLSIVKCPLVIALSIVSACTLQACRGKVLRKEECIGTYHLLLTDTRVGSESCMILRGDGTFVAPGLHLLDDDVPLSGTWILEDDEGAGQFLGLGRYASSIFRKGNGVALHLKESVNNECIKDE
jgi:hypothetical protein